MEQSFFNYNLRPNFSLNDFFVGSANIEAYNLLINTKHTCTYLVHVQLY